jgi:outer membrane receptor protein involved in Fe transport
LIIFLADRPKVCFNTDNNDFDYNKRTPSADYSVLLSSVYLQDEIRLSPKFNVLAGIRVDWQNTPTAFPISDQIKIRLSLQGIE